MGNRTNVVVNFDFVGNTKGLMSALDQVESKMSKVNIKTDKKTPILNDIKRIREAYSELFQMSERGFSSQKEIQAAKRLSNEISGGIDKIKAKIGSLTEVEQIKLLPDNIRAQLRDAQKEYKSLIDSYIKENQKLSASQTALNALKQGREDKDIGLGNKQYKPGSSSKSTTTFNKTQASQYAREIADKYANGDKEVAVKIRLQLTGDTDLQQEIDKELNNIEVNDSKLAKLRNALSNLGVDNTASMNIKQLGEVLKDLPAEKSAKVLDDLRQSFEELDNTDTSPLRGALQEMNQEFDRLTSREAQLQQLTSRVAQFFTITNSIQLFQRGVRGAVNTIKELDAVMTETAVVTDYTVSDMWDQLGRYTELAKDLGATTKGAYETMTLYFQQGLNEEEAFALGTETMKMARIAGMDYAETTDAMTAALRGFNMELNNTSAQRINDVYSELAAKTASDTKEISTAMSKTASIASMAGMEFEETSTFIAKAIETTREAPENIGTAMKTIVARYASLTKDPSTLSQELQDALEGDTVEINKVTEALSSAGVTAVDSDGNFRDLGKVMIELSQKWDSLDEMTQHYIATQMAGTRQQSRFIAMMQDYQRTQTLLNDAYNSSGASATQFAKTQESLEAKLNRLKDAWDQFLMTITNSDMVKGIIDLLYNLINAINKVSDAFGKLGGVFNLFFAGALLKTGKGMFSGLMGGLENLGTKGAGSFAKGFIKNAKKQIKTEFTDGGLINILTEGFKKDEEPDKASDVNTNIINKAKQLFSKNKDIDFSYNDEDKNRLSTFAQDAAQNFDNDEALAAARLTEEKAITKEKIAQLVEEKKLTQEEADQLIAKGAHVAEDGTLIAEDGTRLTINKFITKELAKQSGIMGLTYGQLMLVVTAVTAVIYGLTKLSEWVGPEGEIKRLDSAIEGWDKQLQTIQDSMSELDSAVEALDNNNLDNLQQGTWEWYEQLTKINNQVQELIDKYPQLAAYASVDSNGMLTISDEGFDVVKNYLIAEEKAGLNAKLLAQASKDQVLANEKLNYGSMTKAELSSFDSDQWQEDQKAAKLRANSSGQLAIASMSNDTLAKVYDISKINLDTSKWNAKTDKQLRQEYYQRTGTAASEDISKAELVQMLASYDTQKNMRPEMEKWAPIFEQIGQLSNNTLENLSKMKSDELNQWMKDNIEGWTDGMLEDWNKFLNIDAATSLKKLELINNNDYSEDTFNRTASIRERNIPVKDFMGTKYENKYVGEATAAVNDAYNLTGTNYAFTEDEIRTMVENGTYDGLIAGSAKAGQEVANNILDNFETGDTKDGTIKLDSKAIKDGTNDLNKLLGLTGEAALSTEELEQNWDLVRESINGSVSAAKQLELLGKNKNQLKWINNQLEKSGDISVELANGDKVKTDVQDVLNDINGMAAQVMLGIELDPAQIANLEAKLDEISKRLQNIKGIGPILNSMFRNIVAKFAALSGAKIGWKKVSNAQLDYVDAPANALGLAKDSGKVLAGIKPAEYKSYYQGPKGDGGGGGGGGGSTTPTTPSGGGGGGGGGSKKKKWDNPYDKLYNTEKKINAELRKREKLSTKFEKMLKQWGMTVSELSKNLGEQYKSLQKQIDYNRSMISTKQSMASGAANKFKTKKMSAAALKSYAWYDKDLGEVQINYDKLNKLAKQKGSESKGKVVEEYIKYLEEIADGIHDQEDAIEEAFDAMEELRNQSIDSYDDAMHTIKEALVEEAQKQIDALSTVNDSINDANDRLMKSIDKSLNKLRQDRENKKTEQDLSDKRAQLDMLRRDTSGANASKIKALEKEIADAEENYSDTLVDQQLEKMQSQADAASEQRERQIEILQNILDYESNVSERDGSKFWAEAKELFEEMLANGDQTKSGGTLDSSDRLYQLMLATQLVGETERKIYTTLTELNSNLIQQQATLNESSAKGRAVQEGTRFVHQDKQQDVTAYKNAGANMVWSQAATYDQFGHVVKKGTLKDGYHTYTGAYYDNETGNLVYESSSYNWEQRYQDKLKSIASDKKITAQEFKTAIEYGQGLDTQNKKNLNHTVASIASDLATKLNWTKVLKAAKGAGYSGKTVKKWKSTSSFKKAFEAVYGKWSKFKTGGLADYTGPAWLDGTPSKPELVLNQQDTQNFLQLKDVLSEFTTGRNNNTLGGDTTINIDIKVDQMANDYDAERLAKQIKQEIVKDSQFRNVNTLSRRR